MSSLTRLRETQTLSGLAKLLGFTPSGLSYVLYKLPPERKYTTFEIPKKSGGKRTIKAPEEQLALLQERLAQFLYACVDDIKRDSPRYWHASHGFQKNRTIISNAEVHRRRRFVFNVDLEDFFGAINFGRVRGFFIHDKNFLLPPPVATVVAQIACHENSLPQGSPCSPVISNLVANVLDLRLLALARDARCTYTRYADDLTFSTNEKIFPIEIAQNTFGSEWRAGLRLQKVIVDAGYKLNPSKTRMSLRRSRQTVTGLVVNSKANINRDYYRSVRSMCNSVFREGVYFKAAEGPAAATDNLRPLEGMLSHIHFVKARRDRADKTNKLAIKAEEFLPPQAPVDLFRKFLFYKHFVSPKAPFIITEGISDIAYLNLAIRSLAKNHPLLAGEKDGKYVRLVNFLTPTGISREILNLGHGVTGQGKIVLEYANRLKGYTHKPMEHPVIILADNDSGAEKDVFKHAGKKHGSPITITTTQPFYHLGENLYLVKVPEGSPPGERIIEQLFAPSLLSMTVGGKRFDPKKKHDDASAFGKVHFAEKVIRPLASTIDFSDFSNLLTRLEQCIVHYATVTASSAVAPAASSTTPLT